MPSHPCRASVGHPVWSGTPDGPSCKAQPSSALLRNHTGWVVPVGLSGDSGDPVRAASLLHFLPRLPSLPDGPCRPHGETQASRSVSPHSRAWHPSPRTGRDPPPDPEGRTHRTCRSPPTVLRTSSSTPPAQTPCVETFHSLVNYSRPTAQMSFMGFPSGKSRVLNLRQIRAFIPERQKGGRGVRREGQTDRQAGTVF